VLDFGCGAAKNTRLLRGIDGVRVVGTDVNAAQIEWARKHVPGVEFHVNELQPSLRFAPDDEFDLVTAASVFTHIPLDLQRAWLDEIRRILRPGGYFLCTVAGSYHIGIQLSPELRHRLREEGGVTLGPEDPGVSYATKAAGSCDVFQTREEVLRVFGNAFEVLDYSAKTSGQDHLVLRKSGE
jgi:SAM-dependent methyltransferase